MPITPSWYFKGRKCCKCGSDKTYIDGQTPKWRSCTCRKKSCTKWLCYWCFYDIQRSIHRKIKESRLKCRICGTTKTTTAWRKYVDDKGRWDGKSYMCNKCGCKKWYDDTIKPMRKCRTENIDFSKLEDLGEKDKGRAIEDVVAEVLGLENQNVVSDDFSSPFDLTIHVTHGEIQVKARALDVYNNRRKFELKTSRDYDTLVLVGMDEHWKIIEKVWIIPNEEVIEEMTINIPILGDPRYDKFEVSAIPYNNVLQENINNSKNGSEKKETN